MNQTNVSSHFSPSAWEVLRHRYLRKDTRGVVVETPQEMFRRVAHAVAAVEADYKEDAVYWEEVFFDLMVTLRFLPNSPTLMNAGLPQGQLAACFVLPVEDSLASIFQAVKDMALIHQSGGGTGFSFSHLRPKNDPVASIGGVASGPVSFLRVFDEATNAVKQGGRRRGANMAILRVDHPDIFDFITAKADPGAFTNFNFSVAVDEAFMQAVRAGQGYPLRHPTSGAVVREVRAQELLTAIAQAAWSSGDPGVLFIDEINRHNPTPQLGTLEATNPCAEQPLLPYESCVLGSLNLPRFVREGAVDWESLRTATAQAVRFLDDVIDATHAPVPQIEEMTRQTRKIGLGVMGFADLLISLGIPYGSAESLTLAGRLMEFIAHHAHQASMELAKTGRGPFPAFPGTPWAQQGLPSVRNATVTTIAPTGTISMLAGVSSGIEPLFAVAFTRTVLEGRHLHEMNPALQQTLAQRHLLTADLMGEITARGTLADVSGIPAEVKALFVTSYELAPELHVRMQAAFQRYTDNAVSKTVNLPEAALPSDVEHIICLAHDLRCKGITVFRDGCKGSQVLSLGIPHHATEELGTGKLHVGLEFTGECRNCTV
jgi:ribonucleoside-diphosphate reductase alpha chain